MGQGTEKSLSDLLRNALGDLLAPGASSFVDMMAEDGVFEFPFAPEHGVRRLDGREALRDYIGKLAGTLEIDGFHDVRSLRTDEPGTVVIEFRAEGRSPRTGRPYHQHYVSIVQVRDGRIARYQDFWNPLVVMDTMGDDYGNR